MNKKIIIVLNDYEDCNINIEGYENFNSVDFEFLTDLLNFIKGSYCPIPFPEEVKPIIFDRKEVKN